jgi:hypothetical protein
MRPSQFDGKQGGMLGLVIMGGRRMALGKEGWISRIWTRRAVTDEVPPAPSKI